MRSEEAAKVHELTNHDTRRRNAIVKAFLQPLIHSCVLARVNLESKREIPRAEGGKATFYSCTGRDYYGLALPVEQICFSHGLRLCEATRMPIVYNCLRRNLSPRFTRLCPLTSLLHAQFLWG